MNKINILAICVVISNNYDSSVSRSDLAPRDQWCTSGGFSVPRTAWGYQTGLLSTNGWGVQWPVRGQRTSKREIFSMEGICIVKRNFPLHPQYINQSSKHCSIFSFRPARLLLFGHLQHDPLDLLDQQDYWFAVHPFLTPARLLLCSGPTYLTGKTSVVWRSWLAVSLTSKTTFAWSFPYPLNRTSIREPCRPAVLHDSTPEGGNITKGYYICYGQGSKVVIFLQRQYVFVEQENTKTEVENSFKVLNQIIHLSINKFCSNDFSVFFLTGYKTLGPGQFPELVEKPHSDSAAKFW